MKKPKNYGYVAVLSKALHPVFNALFYVAAFFIVLCFILSMILFFVNVDVETMLLPPFMHKIADEAGKITEYSVSFGNGIKIVTAATNVILDDIKAVLFAGLFVIVCTLLTLAPIFKFLAALLKNISSGERERLLDEKNPRYVSYMGLCIFLGSALVRFMMRFYNYYLAARFIKCEPQQIGLSLGLDLMDGVPGLLILFLGLVLAYVFRQINER
ncbi:MAG: DUF2975 domain-containing protein [Oscillospiraceae bacterium]|nr:DUF2975 domain-containing protein [Oscillospiraceae bacterium]